MLKRAVSQLGPRRWARFLMAMLNCFGAKMGLSTRSKMTKVAWILPSEHRSMKKRLCLEALAALEGLRHFACSVCLNRPDPPRRVAADRDLRKPLRSRPGAGG